MSETSSDYYEAYIREIHEKFSKWFEARFGRPMPQTDLLFLHFFDMHQKEFLTDMENGQ